MMNVVNTAAKATSEMISMTGAGAKSSQASDEDAFSKTLNAFDGEKPASYSDEGEAKGATPAPEGDVPDLSEEAKVQVAPPREVPASSETDLASLSEQMSTGQPAQQPDTTDGKTTSTASEKPGANSQKLAEIAAALAMSTTDGGVTDTKALAAALKKLADSAKTDTDLPTDAADETVDTASTDTTTLDDMLSLLSLPLAGGQTEQTTVAASEFNAAQQGAINGIDAQATGARALPEQAGQDIASGDDASSTEDGAVFRFQRSDPAAAGVDMYVAPGTDGSVDVDVSAPTAKDAPVVQVVDSRRYLGLAPNSNALSVASTIANDPQWATALDPASKLANSALFASTGNVVHTLKIQMNPVELGNITATMRLVGEDLSIHLTVHSSSAYRELTNDSNSIMDALKAQGFSVDQISVSMSSSSDKSGDNAAGGRQASDMGQSQQQGNRQSGGDARQADQFDRTSSGSATAGGNDAGVVEGTVAAGAGSARPEHVYL